MGSVWSISGHYPTPSPATSEPLPALEQRLAERLLTFVLAVVDLPHFMES